jgi:DNA-binding XRE family transcriptional regulator
MEREGWCSMMTRKEKWIKKIEEFRNETLSPKELAEIIGVSIQTVYKHLEVGLLEGAEKRGPLLKSPWDISKLAATNYVATFKDTYEVVELPSKILPFPDWPPN